jgi:hypothetical protein
MSAVWAIVVGVVFLAGVAYAVWQATSRRRLDTRDAELTAQRIDELRRLAALEPAAIPQARDLTPGEVRALRQRQHPIAHKRAGRPI